MTKKVVESKNEPVTSYKADVDGDGIPDSVAPGGPPSSNRVRGVYGMRVARRIKEEKDSEVALIPYRKSLIKKGHAYVKDGIFVHKLHDGTVRTTRKKGHILVNALHKDEPTALAHIEKIKSLKEEAPTVNAGSGNIAGIGVGPKGEPGVSKANQKKHGKNILRRSPPQSIPMGTFWGKKTFIVPDRMVNEVRMQKRKGKWWTNYLDEDNEISNAIREYANAHPCEPIILEGENYGNIVFARYGKS